MNRRKVIRFAKGQQQQSKISQLAWMGRSIVDSLRHELGWAIQLGAFPKDMEETKKELDKVVELLTSINTKMENLQAKGLIAFVREEADE